MTCAACADRVEKKLNTIDDVVATVNFATEGTIVTAPGLSRCSSSLTPRHPDHKVGVIRELQARGRPLSLGSGAALAHGRLTVVRGNLAWASGYNITAIPLPAAGFLNPLIAGAAMATSSAFVMANSGRLGHFGGPARSRERVR